MDYSALITSSHRDAIVQWLQMDCPSFDVGGFVVGSEPKEFQIICKQDCILSGVHFANIVFSYLGLQYSWHYQEGSALKPCESQNGKIIIGVASGPCNKLLLAERTVLNIISRASGVATAANQLSSIALEFGWKGSIAGTRKTTPGFGFVEKYSLLVGGCSTHRHDLSQMTMLKDNHIASKGSITNAVKSAKLCTGFSSKIEVECKTTADALESCAAGADIVMLDNFTAEEAGVSARLIKDSFPTVIIEASGGINRETIRSYMSDHIDVISIGALTHGYSVIDFSFKIKT